MDIVSGAGLLVGAAGAGGVDAIVGGGGLIQLPILLLAFPRVPTSTALGTNKLASISGTSTAAVTFARRTPLDRRVVFPAAAMAVVCASLGALSAASLPTQIFRPFIMVLLLSVAAFVALRPTFGSADGVDGADGISRRRRIATTMIAGCGIGFYDGIFGPGTGTFLIILFTVGLASEFVRSSAMSKVVNTGTNLGALIVFALEGHVMWALGFGMGLCNITGATLGARLALKKGSGFVRVVLVVVVTALVVKLGFDQFG